MTPNQLNKQIDGKTSVYGLIGNPVSHTLSPVIHNTIAERFGDNLAYLPFFVREGQVEQAVTGAYALNIQGLNVTIPYKKAVIPCLCRIDRDAEIIGSVNTLKYTPDGYYGYNTDFIGIINTFKNHNISVQGKTALVLGAGGSACPAVAALCRMGAKKICIANRTLETAKTLANHFTKYYNIDIEAVSFEQANVHSGAEVIMQTTALGFGEFSGQSPVSNVSIFEDAEFVFELIYAPWETVFLRDARKCGCLAVNGFEMLIFQAVASYEIWLERKLDEDKVIELMRGIEEYVRADGTAG